MPWRNHRGTREGTRSRRRSATAGPGRCATCASRSPTAATSAAAYCMPREVYGRDYAFLPRARAADLRGDRAPGRRLRRARRAQAPAHRRRAAAAPRPADARRACSRRRRASSDIALTTNGSLLAAHGASAARARACSASRSASTRSTSNCSRRMNDAASRCAGARRHRRGRSRRASRRSRSTWSSRRGINEARGLLDMARFARERRLHPAVHRVHGRGPHQRLDRIGGRASGRDPRRDLPRCPGRTLPPRDPGEVAERWRYRDGRARSG